MDRFSRTSVLVTSLAIMTTGLVLTLLSSLPCVVVGVVVFTIGFFGTHSVASAWVGAMATQARGQASSLYLFSYYMGSSLSGTAGGFFYDLWDWGGVVLLILLLIAVAAGASFYLSVLTREQTSKVIQSASIPS